ncbi:MAG: radical SAM protein [Anaerolineaceae bacterium]|jgi:organic radical activating enzyme|nr:MAG: radical SAM protein [Anaerolineaceae bacterium]
MFTKIKEKIDKLLEPVKPVPVGSYQFQGKKDSQAPYRLNLRVEPNGEGILIINASTVLHLNRTAAEYAYHLVQQTPIDQAAQEIAEKYEISIEDAKHDFADFSEHLNTVIHTPDLDPITYLDLERVEPYSKKLSAPYRLDCALTYQVSEKATPDSAPTYRVKRELTKQEWYTILEKARQAGIPQVVFTGGEPTLRPDLPDLISKCEELGIVSGLLTDGLRFSEKRYMKTILNSGLDHIMLLGAPADERFWKALQNLIADDIAITVHLTLTDENLAELQQAVPKLAASGLRSLSLSASDPDLEKTLTKFQNLAIDQGLSLVWDLPVPYSQYNPITLELKSGGKRLAKGAGNAWLYVEPDGDVLPAQGINRVMGNLLDDPWASIWKKR